MLKDAPHFDSTFQDVVHYVTRNGTGVPQTDLPLVMWEDVVNESRNYILNHVNRHLDFYSLCIVRRGRGTHIIEGIAYAISRGDVYVMGQNTTHCYTQCDDLIVQNFFFVPALFDMLMWQALGSVPSLPSLIPGLLEGTQGERRAGRWLHLTPEACDQVDDELHELAREWDTLVPGRALLLRSLFTRLLIHLARYQREAHPAQAAATLEDRPSAVTAAIRFMEERYAEPLRIEEVAASVFLSASRFTRVFDEAMGQTPREYLRYLRIERAKGLLKTTELSMTVIAGQSGFAEPAYFTRAFHAATGMTPRDFRRQAREAPLAPPR